MKQLLVLLFLLCSAKVFAQDVIVKKDGSTIQCRVVELTDSEITYKKWSDQNGSNYVINRADASAINYENGKKINLSEATNLYQSNNQNDGMQQYNDRALLAIDAASYQYKKVKTLKTIGWSGLLGIGLGAFSLYKSANVYHGKEYYTLAGGILVAGSILMSTYCFIKAHKISDNDIRLQSSTLYQYDFNINNGKSLSAGIDILSDHNIGNKSLGLGLRYNF